MAELYGVLNKTLAPIKYSGVTTDTAQVEIDNNNKTIAVNVLGSPSSGLPEVTDKDNGRWLEVVDGEWVVTDGVIGHEEATLYDKELVDGERPWDSDNNEDIVTVAGDTKETTPTIHLDAQAYLTNDIDWSQATIKFVTDLYPDGIELEFAEYYYGYYSFEYQNETLGDEIYAYLGDGVIGYDVSTFC